MVIANNVLAMHANRQYGINSRKFKLSTEKLSSGYKINRAADNAAGLSISEKMRSQIRGLNQGTENMQDGVSWIQIGDGAMEEIHTILRRMTELSVMGANGTLSPSDRAAIDAEIRELKVEINRINETTEFNDKRIFSSECDPLDDNGEITVKEIKGFLDDLKVFNSTYDDVTGNLDYGGIVFHGNRVSWDEIEPDMVYTDGNTQKFHAGTWVYMDAQNRTLTISANEGDEVPSITRIYDITARDKGIYVDDELIEWKDIKNSHGQTVSDTDYLNGTWTADYHGADISFEITNAYNKLSGLIDAINSGQDENRFRIYAVYAGNSEVQAVNANVGLQNVKVSRDVAETIVNGKGYVVKADKNGLWLQDDDGNDISGSKKSWSDMGIASWEHGDDIKADYEYVYSETGRTDDTYITFSFTVSDITSRDSVIDGLDGIHITYADVVNSYDTTLNVDTSGNVKKGTLIEDTRVSLKEELDLNRDFHAKEQTVGSSAMQYDPSVSEITLSHAGDSGKVITYTGSDSDIKSKMAEDLKEYEDSVIALKINQLLTGIDNLDLTSKDLKDLPGADKVDNQNEYALTLTSPSNGFQKFTYTYDYENYRDQIQVDMVSDNTNGQYVKNASGTGYEEYDSSDPAMAGLERFNIQISYRDMGGNVDTSQQGTKSIQVNGRLVQTSTKGDYEKARESYAVNAITEMVQASDVALVAKNYTTASYYGNGLPNAAIDSKFQSYAIRIPPRKQNAVKVLDAIQIQKSGDVPNNLLIPRFSLNTNALGLTGASCMTQDASRNTIDMINRALTLVSSRRSTFGALQNCLEHAIKSNENTEENTTASESRIRDTDMAKEMVAYANSQIVLQASQAMLSQANQNTQGILSILQG